MYARVGSGGRPVANSSMPMIVRFGLAVMQMGLAERDNMMSTSVWCRYVRLGHIFSFVRGHHYWIKALLGPRMAFLLKCYYSSSGKSTILMRYGVYLKFNGRYYNPFLIMVKTYISNQRLLT